MHPVADMRCRSTFRSDSGPEPDMRYMHSNYGKCPEGGPWRKCRTSQHGICRRTSVTTAHRAVSVGTAPDRSTCQQTHLAGVRGVNRRSSSLPAASASSSSSSSLSFPLPSVNLFVTPCGWGVTEQNLHPRTLSVIPLLSASERPQTRVSFGVIVFSNDP